MIDPLSRPKMLDITRLTQEVDAVIGSFDKGRRSNPKQQKLGTKHQHFE